MLDNYRVVAVIPAGRRRYLQILIPYLQAQKAVLDACHFWCNTVDPNDIAYMDMVASKDPFFQVIPPQIPVHDCWSIHHFFRSCTDPNTIYVRFDDDICWIAPDAVEKLVRFRVSHPEYFLVYANTINNGICSHLHQRFGCISLEEGFCDYDAMGQVGHNTPAFARLAHMAFLQRLEAGDLTQYYFSQWVAWNYEQISINCMSWLGSDFAEFGGEVDRDEEPWLTIHLPRRFNRPSAICGDALVVHFAYYTQRDWLEAKTDLLERYRLLSVRKSGV